MGLCRSASGSHPAPVPRCCGGCTPEGRVSLPCRHVRVGAGTVFRPGSAKRFPEGCGNRHGAGTGPAEAAQGLALPCRQFMAVAKAGPAFWASGAWRAAARHSEQSGQILRYGLPQIKKISVFCGQGPVTAPASFAGGRRAGAGQFPHGGGKSPMGWFGERREKRLRRGESPGRQREGTVRVPADRQGCRIGPRRKRRLSRRGCAGRQHAGKGDVLRVCCSEALQSIGMSRADGSLHTCNDWGPCRRLQKLFPQ